MSPHFVGTSNVQFALEHGLTPLGTMAHEYLQACQAVGPRLTAYFDRPWRDDEVRETALVVIGESPLDRAGITASLSRAAA